MAQRVEVLITCDHPGHDEPTVGEPFAFSTADGRAVSVDLCAEHRDEIVAAIAAVDAFAALGTSSPRVPTARRGRARAGTRSKAPVAAEASPATVRQWALANGVPVPSRGRLPAAVVEQYRAASA